MALDESECLTSRPGRFTHGGKPVPIVEEAGWAPGMEDVAPTGIRSPYHPYTLYATSWYFLLTKYHSDDHIKKNEMGRACGMCGGGREERWIHGFGEETWGKDITRKTQA